MPNSDTSTLQLLSLTLSTFYLGMYIHSALPLPTPLSSYLIIFLTSPKLHLLISIASITFYFILVCSVDGWRTKITENLTQLPPADEIAAGVSDYVCSKLSHSSSFSSSTTSTSTSTSATTNANARINNEHVYDSTLESPQFSSSSISFNKTHTPSKSPKKPHNPLNNLIVISHPEQTRITPNDKPFKFSNDFFEGEVLLMFKNPDGPNDAVQQRFTDKARVFEFQFQGRFKKVPSGPVFLGCEFEKEGKMGMIQRALVSAGLSWVKKVNKGFDYSLNDKRSSNTDYVESGEYEKPHVAFPIQYAVDRLVETTDEELKNGTPLPPLGGDIFEDLALVKKRKTGAPDSAFNGWCTTSTYTIAIWSSYVDWIKWRVVNMPGVRPFCLSGCNGGQPVSFIVYELNEDNNSDADADADAGTDGSDGDGDATPSSSTPSSSSSSSSSSASPSAGRVGAHNQNKIQRFAHLEITNHGITTGGAGEAWVNLHGVDVDVDPNEHTHTTKDEIEGSSRSNSNGGGGNGDGTRGVITEQNEHDHQQGSNMENSEINSDDESDDFSLDLKAGVFVRSNDSIILKEESILILPETDTSAYSYSHSYSHSHAYTYTDTDTGIGRSNSSNTTCNTESSCVTDGGGFAVLQQGATTSTIELQKVNIASKPSSPPSSGPSSGSGGGTNNKQYKQSQLLRGGDQVTIKLISHANSSASDSSVKYLSTHRGWWIKWVSQPPTKNGTFTISEVGRGVGNDVGNNGEILGVGEGFVLRHTRWPAYVVGVSNAGSAKYGGRTLGLLFKPLAAVVGDGGGGVGGSEKEEMISQSGSGSGGGGKKPWLDELRLCAYHAHASTLTDAVLPMSLDRSASEKEFSLQGLRVDVPAWIEMMHRTKRKRVLAYVVRANVELSEDEINDDKEEDKDKEEGGDKDKRAAFITLRTGGDLTPILQLRRDSVAPLLPRLNSPGLDIDSDVVNSLNDHRTSTSTSTDDLSPTKSSSPSTSSINTNKPSAHQNAPDQSTCLLSSLLSSMSSPSPPLTPSTLLSAQMHRPSELDAWILQGGPAELGVTPMSGGSKHPKDIYKPAHDCVCLRALWESHWREEWCGIYESHVAFYAPLTKKPNTVLYHKDVIRVRIIPHDQCPLPSLYILTIDTPGRVHYLAFLTEEKRQTFATFLKMSVFKATDSDSGMIYKAHSHDTIATDPRENFVVKSGLWRGVEGSGRSNWRVVLNARRMRFDDGEFGVKRQIELLQGGGNIDGDGDEGGEKKKKDEGEGWSPKRSPERMSNGKNDPTTFDLDDEESSDDSDSSSTGTPQKSIRSSSPKSKIKTNHISDFIEDLLRSALSLSSESSLESLVNFLDRTSLLRSLSLPSIDTTSSSAVCIWINLYHCLLQHALLLLGPPSKNSVSHFMKCVCYEIGNDVFSLSEIEHCIIRGNLTQPIHCKHNVIEPPKSSIESYKQYAITSTLVDTRINFVLNNVYGSSNYGVQVLTSKLSVSTQLNSIATSFIAKGLAVDVKRRMVVLPDVCKIYANDFLNSSSSVSASNNTNNANANANANANPNIAIISCLSYLLRFLSKKEWSEVSFLLGDWDNEKASKVVVKFKEGGGVVCSLDEIMV